MNREASVLDPRFEALIDRISERQRADFGHMVSDVKADGSLVTDCDRWSDAALVQGLAELFPGEGVLSEEGQHCVPAGSAYWVVDPLDGTTNFAAGIPYWAISIARFSEGVPVLAILEVPPLRQRIVAIRGQGAWRNGKRLTPPASQERLHGSSCASLCSRSIRVLQCLPQRRFPAKIRLLGVASRAAMVCPIATLTRLRLATPSKRILPGKRRSGSFCSTPIERLQREAQPTGWLSRDGASSRLPLRQAPRPRTATMRCRRGGTSRMANAGSPASKRAMEMAQ